eukprot:1155348-Pelagomonas_calceolata.AAC.7
MMRHQEVLGPWYICLAGKGGVVCSLPSELPVELVMHEASSRSAGSLICLAGKGGAVCSLPSELPVEGGGKAAHDGYTGGGSEKRSADAQEVPLMLVQDVHGQGDSSFFRLSLLPKIACLVPTF